MFLVLLLSGWQAEAADYAIAYAIDGGGHRESGIIEECNYRTSCKIKFTDGFELWINASGASYDTVDIDIYGDRFGCCFFYDGARSASRDGRSLIQLKVYEGYPRKRNEFVVNFPIAVVFLLLAKPQ